MIVTWANKPATQEKVKNKSTWFRRKQAYKRFLKEMRAPRNLLTEARMTYCIEVVKLRLMNWSLKCGSLQNYLGGKYALEFIMIMYLCGYSFDAIDTLVYIYPHLMNFFKLRDWTSKTLSLGDLMSPKYITFYL